MENPTKARIVSFALACGMLATAFIPQTGDAAPAPAPVASAEPTTPPAAEVPAPEPEPTQEPEPVETTEPPAPAEKPTPQFPRSELNIMGQGVWDTFQKDIVILDLTGAQTKDANFGDRVVVDFDPAATVGSELPLVVGLAPYTTTYTLRVLETSPETGTVYLIVG